MRKFRKIVESISAPEIQDLWLDKGALKYYGNNGWELVFKDTFQPNINNVLEVKMSESDFTKVLNGISVPIKVDSANSNYDILNVKVGEYNYYLGRVIKTNGTASYTVTNIIGSNVNSMDAIVSDGVITLSSKLTSLKEILELEIGNTSQVKTSNLETLKGKDLFFACLDYGYGVGSWQPSVGGKIHVITADGVFVFYTIHSDGAIIKEAEKDLDNLEGLPAGGVEGQILTKTAQGSEWQTKELLPSGGKENQYLSVNNQGILTWKDFDLEELYSYGVEWDINVANPKVNRIGNPLLHKTLPIQSQYRGCVAKGKIINYYLHPNDWSKKLNGTPSVLDGTDGTIRIHTPKFYGKSGQYSTKKWVKMSLYKIDNTWQEIPEMLVDAFRCTVDKTDPSKLLAVSVINTTANFRGGGDRAANDEYLNTDIYRSDLGKPRTSIPRSTMRTYAKNAGSELLCYEFYKWIIYWAFVVEYATFDSQAPVNNNLTPEGYHQGGLGSGLTNFNKWNEYNNTYPVANCGCCNSLGNFSGELSITIPETVVGATTVPAQTLKVNKYRGFENPFGHIWLNLDGVILKREAPNEQSNVYTTDITNDFGEGIEAMNKMRVAGVEVPMDGNIKEFDLRERGEIIPLLIGGNSSMYKCDYHWCNPTNTSLRTLLVGGHAYDGAYAGLGCFYSHSGVGHAHPYVGFLTLNRI